MSENRMKRSISDVWDVSYQAGQGPHVKVGYVLQSGAWEKFDPFLIMNEDWFKRGTFGAHPHRGLETITYIIDGALEHKDNRDGHGVITSGDAQWMTAGRGIIHSEEPVGESTVHTLQLWVNLPADKKMTEPGYQDLYAKDMPVRIGNGATVRVFSGSSADVKAPTRNHVPVTMVEINLTPGSCITQDLPGSYNGFIYVLEGSGIFGGNQTLGHPQQVLWLGSGDKSESEISLQAVDEPLRVLLFAGEPIGENVVARGPFVMNTHEEIVEAYKDYREGKFG